MFNLIGTAADYLTPPARRPDWQDTWTMQRTRRHAMTSLSAAYAAAGRTLAGALATVLLLAGAYLIGWGSGDIGGAEQLAATVILGAGVLLVLLGLGLCGYVLFTGAQLVGALRAWSKVRNLDGGPGVRPLLTLGLLLRVVLGVLVLAAGVAMVLVRQEVFAPEFLNSLHGSAQALWQWAAGVIGIVAGLAALAGFVLSAVALRRPRPQKAVSGDEGQGSGVPQEGAHGADGTGAPGPGGPGPGGPGAGPQAGAQAGAAGSGAPDEALQQTAVGGMATPTPSGAAPAGAGPTAGRSGGGSASAAGGGGGAGVPGGGGPGGDVAGGAGTGAAAAGWPQPGQSGQGQPADDPWQPSAQPAQPAQYGAQPAQPAQPAQYSAHPTQNPAQPAHHLEQPAPASSAVDDVADTRLASQVPRPSAPGIGAVLPDGQQVTTPGVTLLGRAPTAGANETVGATAAINDVSVSKTHLSLRIEGEGIWATDRASTNGTDLYRSGHRYSLVAWEEAPLEPGDELVLGRASVRIDRV